ncbi:MAG: amidohydrolase family protein, partial [Planctomycetota bacterium]
MSTGKRETQKKRFAADLTWTGAAFEPGVAVEIRGDGRFGDVGPARGDETKLVRRALIPGFCNAHSHAFQRGLRGLGESFPKGAGSFWTWREAMYGLVETMTADRIHQLSHQAFREMLAAGMTSVGEFHYLHHSAAGQDFAFDKEVLR